MPVIQEILKKSIDRSINGVVTAENNDEEILFNELDEYVITGEVKKHLYKFFDKYVDTLGKPTTQTGIWVSGFFGSGKSHLLKMIGHMLKNDTVKGTKAVDFFNDKLKNDNMLLENIKKSAGISTDVILFNIDNVGDQNARSNKDTIVIAFLKKFNQYLGFSRDDIKVADFEWGLWKKGKFEEFKDIFKDIAGTEWEDARRNLTFEADFFLETIEKLSLDGLSVKSAETWLESSRDKSYSPEAFMDILKEYLDIKGKNHRMIFLVDEVGQYIGDNKALMLNLQTVTEQLGDTFKGKIWIGVTSQQDIGSILKDEFKNHTDFSKIQGRFPTMLNLASADIEEVIKKRLLENFDEEVHEKLKVNLQKSTEYLNKYETWLWSLTKYFLNDLAKFDDENNSFEIFEDNDLYSLKKGFYKLGLREDGYNIYRLGHPLAQHILDTYKSLETKSSYIAFDYTNSDKKITLIEDLIGKKGYLDISNFSIEALESEDEILYSGFTDDGKTIDKEVLKRFFSLPIKEKSEEVNIDNGIREQLSNLISSYSTDIINSNMEKNNSFFDEEMDKLEKWADDLKNSIEIELKELEKEIKTTKTESKKITKLEAKIEAQKLIKDMEKRRNKLRQNLFTHQDEIEEKKDNLISDIENKLKQSTRLENLFTIRWEII